MYQNTKKRLKVGVVGCGVIGTRIAEAIDKGEVRASLVAVADLELQKAEALVGGLVNETPQIRTIEEVFALSDFIIEAASVRAVPQVIRLSMEWKKDCMILSVGGLLGNDEILEKAESTGISIYCPSGAIAGLDAVAAASTGRIDLVRLTTTKPPKGLKGSSYLKEKGIDPDRLQEAVTIYEGSAADAVSLFPKNINVAAALSLAGVGPERTIVKIIADPNVTRNSHQIEVEGEFGRLVTKTENLPAPFNPRTSYLAALSAVSCLKRITSCLKVGG